MDKFSPAALTYAIEQSKKDSKPLFELVDKNRNTDSLIRGKSKGKKHIELSILQPIIDKYPKFLIYLEEGEQLAKEPLPSEASTSDVVALLKDLKEGQADLKRSVALLLDQCNYTSRYIDLLEKRNGNLVETTDVELKIS